MSRRVGVDLLWLVSGDVGGSEEYATSVLLAYAAHGSSSIRPVVFLTEAAAEAHPDLGRMLDVETRSLDNRQRWRRLVAETTWLAARIRRLDAAHHVGGRIPMRTARPTAVTVHDLQPLDHPEHFSVVKRTYLRRALPRSLTRADLVVTPSAAVGAEVSRRFLIDPGRVTTVSAGVPTVATEPSHPTDPPTILYPAVTHPHKRHDVLVEAFHRLAAEHPTVRLVLTGGRGRADDRVRTLAATGPHADRIDWMGRIAADDLSDHLAVAGVLAFPSAYEGFGLPVLEAMAAGVPVLVAEGTPAADLVGPAARVPVDAGPADWARRLRRVLDESGHREDLSLDGLQRAAGLRWEHTAEALERAWRLLLEAGRR